jgi:hypothetical protein
MSLWKPRQDALRFFRSASGRTVVCRHFLVPRLLRIEGAAKYLSATTGEAPRGGDTVAYSTLAFICPSLFGCRGAGRKEKWLGTDRILHRGNYGFDAETFDIDDEEWRTPNGGQSGMGIMAVSRELCSNGYSCSGSLIVARRFRLPEAY